MEQLDLSAIPVSEPELEYATTETTKPSISEQLTELPGETFEDIFAAGADVDA